MSTFDSLNSFLYGDAARLGYTCPQFAFMGVQKNLEKYTIWFPGAKKVNELKSVPKNIWLHGFGGRVYKTYSKLRKEQEYLLAWTSLDIDDINIVEVAPKIKKLIPECSIRESKSGQGVHLFFRFDKPLYFQAGESDLVTQKIFLAPYMDTLKENEIPICTPASSILWLTGAGHKGDFIYLSEAKLRCKKQKYSSCVSSNTEEQGFLVGKMQKFIDLLANAGAILSDWDGESYTIYVRAAYEACKGTEFEFRTRSPMQTPEPHANGFIRFANSALYLRAKADSQDCLTISQYLVNI